MSGSKQRMKLSFDSLRVFSQWLSRRVLGVWVYTLFGWIQPDPKSVLRYGIYHHRSLFSFETCPSCCHCECLEKDDLDEHILGRRTCDKPSFLLESLHNEVSMKHDGPCHIFPGLLPTVCRDVFDLFRTTNQRILSIASIRLISGLSSKIVPPKCRIYLPYNSLFDVPIRAMAFRAHNRLRLLSWNPLMKASFTIVFWNGEFGHA